MQTAIVRSPSEGYQSEIPFSYSIHSIQYIPQIMAHGYFTAWHWGNHNIAPVDVNQPWRIWAKRSRNFTKNFDINKMKYNRIVTFPPIYISDTHTFAYMN